MESGTDGIGWEGSESTLYGKQHRLGDAQADLGKCKGWTSMSDAERQSHADKRCMQPFKTVQSAHSCDLCKGTIPVGARILRCERCDWDVCDKCKGG